LSKICPNNLVLELILNLVTLFSFLKGEPGDLASPPRKKKKTLVEPPAMGNAY
jgi:hypothetical protein